MWINWDMDGDLTFTLQQRSGNLDIPESIYQGLRDGNSTKQSAVAKSLRRLVVVITERTVSPLSKLTVKTVNSTAVTDRKIESLLEEAGFRPKGTGDWVCRPRPIGLR